MKTSLTTKEYIATPPSEHQQSAASDTASETIQYDVLLDAGDAHSMGASSSSPSKASGVDLELIHDVHLTRIRNAQIPDYFDRFDTVLQRFVPSPVLQFQYPVDTTTSGVVATMNHHPRRAFLSPEMEDLCHEVVQGVQALAGQLERIILDETSCLTKDRNLTLLATIQARLQALSRGQLSSSSSSSRQQQQEKDGQFPLTRAAEHLHAWLLLQLELLDVCWQRHQVLEYSSVDDDDDDDDKQPPLYRIGQVVTHTHYNYRGIVVGWDPKPTVDVSRWDGLQHLSAEKVQEMPFYHVVPDPYDCMRVFGGERGLRYVCQENLAVCPPDETDVEIEFEDEEWKREEVPGVGFRYRAPGQLLFKYAQEEGDAGKITERCMNQILKMINTWQYQACTDTVPPDSVASSLTMSNFMKLLQNADSLEDATPIQETIKEIRKAHRRLDLRWQLERGMTELMAGKGQRALEIFQDIVQDDPEYVEGWNKRATCEFMLGQYDASTVSTEKTLELDPNHFQSLNGLGLIHYQKDEYQEAVDCFRRSLELDPWSPVTSKLATCIDLLAHKVLSDELSN